MKKTNLLKSMLLLCALVAGSGSVWAIDVKVGGVEFAASDDYKSSTYSATEWEYDSWTLTYAANNGGKWAHVRCGGKSSVSPASSTIVSPQITSPITKVTITNEGINGNSAGYAISSITLEAFSDAGLTSKTSTTTLSGVTLPTFGTSSSPSSFDITPASTIAANSYIKISISWSTSNSKNGGLDITNIDVYNTVTSTPATITSTSGFATLFTPYALDFSSLSSELKAYTATTDGSTVTLTEVSDVPANTGVVLKGAVKTHNIPVIASSETAKGSMEGSTSEAMAWNGKSGYDLYMLALNGEGKAQFKKVTSGSIAAGKAYLPIATGGGAHVMDVVFGDGDVTAINKIEAAKQNAGVYYNLAGQRIAHPTKGLYIMNGKKVIIK